MTDSSNLFLTQQRTRQENKFNFAAIQLYVCFEKEIARVNKNSLN